MGDFKRLIVWQRSRAFVAAIYRVTGTFPADERFSLTGQLRRAAVSVAANIAEGAGKKNDAELSRFLRIARGSLHEVEALLILSLDLQFVAPDSFDPLCAELHELSRMLNRLINHASSRTRH